MTLRGLILALGMAVPQVLAGNLNPPGAPGPTDRTPIHSLPLTIDQPGSYVLMRDIQTNEGFYITANDVTIDLNGFTIRGTDASSVGVRSEAVHNIVIRNGTFTDFDGTTLFIPGAFDVVLEDLRIRNGGFTGINVFNQVQIRNCIVENCFGWGIEGGHGISVEGCLIRACGTDAQGGGISLGDNSSVTDCTLELNSNAGIKVGNGCAVAGCVVGDTRANSASNGIGIEVGAGCSISDSTARGNGGYGIATDAHSRLSGCTADFNTGRGIDAGEGSSLVECIGSRTREFPGVQQGVGIFVRSDSVVSNCVATANARDGIETGSGVTLTHCVSSRNTGIGIELGGGCVAVGCVARDNFNSTGLSNGIGFLVPGGSTVAHSSALDNASDGFLMMGSNLITSNTASENRDGFGLTESADDNLLTNNVSFSNDEQDIQTFGSDNVIVRNKFVTSSIDPTDDVAPLVKVSTSTNPNVNYRGF